MRVIAGKYRSRTLRSLKGQALRPTSDRLRETLFNILGQDVKDSVFVDLFAGTGAVGIEALSRGASSAMFVEKRRSAVAVIHHNLQTLGVAGEAHVIAADVLQALERLEASNMHADFIFLDPPYDAGEAYENALDFLGRSQLLAAGGRVIAEHFHKRKLPEHVGTLELTRVVEQGDSALNIYRVAFIPDERSPKAS
jgi:16S rRNA (guanine966-N2)-methyltransferase